MMRLPLHSPCLAIALPVGRPFLRRIPLHGRFTPLLLDHSEYYFRRLEAIAVLTLPIDSGAGTAAAARGTQDERLEREENGKAVERRSVKGILHVCGHSVVFEPVRGSSSFPMTPP